MGPRRLHRGSQSDSPVQSGKNERVLTSARSCRSVRATVPVIHRTAAGPRFEAEELAISFLK